VYSDYAKSGIVFKIRLNNPNQSCPNAPTKFYKINPNPVILLLAKYQNSPNPVILLLAKYQNSPNPVIRDYDYL
jgi:hypothetical protein